MDCNVANSNTWISAHRIITSRDVLIIVVPVVLVNYVPRMSTSRIVLIIVVPIVLVNYAHGIITRESF